MNEAQFLAVIELGIRRLILPELLHKVSVNDYISSNQQFTGTTESTRKYNEKLYSSGKGPVFRASS